MVLIYVQQTGQVRIFCVAHFSFALTCSDFVFVKSRANLCGLEV